MVAVDPETLELNRLVARKLVGRLHYPNPSKDVLERILEEDPKYIAGPLVASLQDDESKPYSIRALKEMGPNEHSVKFLVYALSCDVRRDTAIDILHHYGRNGYVIEALFKNINNPDIGDLSKKLLRDIGTNF